MALRLLIVSINQGTFVWKNHAKNRCQNLVPDPFLILVNNLKQPWMQEFLLKIRYF